MLSGSDVGVRMLADVNGDGIYDVGDGIVVNLSEPFTDTNGNLVFEPELGETFSDVGLDGVAGTGDYGEGNGQVDYDPDRANWLAEDPLTRLKRARQRTSVRSASTWTSAAKTSSALASTTTISLQCSNPKG